jgi:hypothetical protein
VVSEHDTYRTSELTLAAVGPGLSPGHHRLRAQEPPQFVFRRETGLDELIAQYWRGELQVEP